LDIFLYCGAGGRIEEGERIRGKMGGRRVKERGERGRGEKKER
jgi:hypothetical protein